MDKLGMDADAIEALASQLDSQVTDLARVVSVVDGLVARALFEWHGRSAETFSAEWHNAYRPAVLRAADNLSGLADSARNNAAEQRRGSGAAPVGLADWFDTLRPFGEWGMPALGLASAGLTAWLARLVQDDPQLAKALMLSEKFGKRFLGPIAIGFDAASYARDLSKPDGGTSVATMNDQLNIDLDVVSTVADFDPLTGLLAAGAMAGLAVVEHADPTLTADVYRLGNPVAEISGAVGDHLADHDYNPADIAGQVMKDDFDAASDLLSQEFAGLSAGGGWIARGVRGLLSW